MHFLQQNMLLLLPLALVGAAIVAAAWRRQLYMLSAWGSKDAVEKPYAKPLMRQRFVAKGLMSALAIALSVVALARPFAQTKYVEFAQGTIDVVVVVDVSRSMGARDCQGVSRMNTARAIIREKISPSMNHNQIGIIAYAGKAQPVVFLTEELETVNWLAENELKIASAPGQGSAMGHAFDLAFKYFDHDSDQTRTRIIVLLSDGGTDDDTNLGAIVAGCAKRDVRLIVGGMGLPVPAVIPMEELSDEDRRMSMDQFYKIDGKTAMTSLEVGTLSQLVEAVGAKSQYVKVTSVADFDFQPLTSDLKPKEKFGQKEFYFIPCLAFFILVLVTPAVTAKRVKPPARRQRGSTPQAVAHLPRTLISKETPR